ncbi:OadG family protein [Tetragenococcus solitarius]|uniref:Oxaloacetate decarboxylase (Na(+) extruding) n=1 Tax=Tetragenococcus solitarius TaxID=71453 RepID=A0ABN3XZ24_9ENTE|nr:OadG family protein [Tetragenococcus solitarius]
MANFTILDGLVLMIVAMATVFAVLMGLWGILVVVKILVEKQSKTQAAPASNPQPEVTSNQEKNSEQSAEKGTIPPEKVALIMSLLVDKNKRNKEK